MKEVIRDKYKIEMELVPPGCHQRNAAEVSIRNFKAHFFSVLAGVAENSPLNFWDRLLPQTELTLNLLRQSNATPTFSAYTHFSGPFNYNNFRLFRWAVQRRSMKKLTSAAPGTTIQSMVGIFSL